MFLWSSKLIYVIFLGREIEKRSNILMDSSSFQFFHNLRRDSYPRCWNRIVEREAACICDAHVSTRMIRRWIIVAVDNKRLRQFRQEVISALRMLRNSERKFFSISFTTFYWKKILLEKLCDKLIRVSLNIHISHLKCHYRYFIRDISCHIITQAIEFEKLIKKEIINNSFILI